MLICNSHLHLFYSHDNCVFSLIYKIVLKRSNISSYELKMCSILCVLFCILQVPLRDFMRSRPRWTYMSALDWPGYDDPLQQIGADSELDSFQAIDFRQSQLQSVPLADAAQLTAPKQPLFFRRASDLSSSARISADENCERTPGSASALILAAQLECDSAYQCENATLNAFACALALTISQSTAAKLGCSLAQSRLVSATELQGSALETNGNQACLSLFNEQTISFSDRWLIIVLFG